MHIPATHDLNGKARRSNLFLRGANTSGVLVDAEHDVTSAQQFNCAAAVAGPNFK
jgi:hypothetical protein